MKTGFTPASTTNCPITYEVQTTADGGTTYTKYNDTSTVYYNNVFEVYVNFAPQVRTPYFQAASDIFVTTARHPFFVEVCGDEVVSLTGNSE